MVKHSVLTDKKKKKTKEMLIHVEKCGTLKKTKKINKNLNFKIYSGHFSFTLSVKRLE